MIVYTKVVEAFEQFLFRILEVNGWPLSQRLSSKETLDIPHSPHKIHVIGTFIPTFTIQIHESCRYIYQVFLLRG